jgi:MinD-like ATPase involved in chromosome partitioning or flagellar assembly
MAADYDRLFQPSEGAELPDDATAQTDYDVNAPHPTPPPPTSPPKPPPAPMPVDLTTQPPPTRPESRTEAPPPQARPARRRRRDRAKSQHGQKKAATGPSMPLQPPADPQAAVQPDSTPATKGGNHRGKRAVSDLGVESVPKKSTAKMVSRRGWRRWVHTLTRINFGLSRDEKYELDLYTRVRRNIRGSYEIGVLGLKGGVGKTAVTVALGSVFAQLRGDRILALDADPVSGNLADRAGCEPDATIADLVANDALSHYNDVRAHTSMNPVNLEVLSAADYIGPRPLLSEEDWRAVAVVPRFYNLVLADCGADLFGPATRSMLSTASGLVIVSSASIDGIQQAAVAGDWLHNNGYRDLLSRACAVINHVVPGEPNKEVNDMVLRLQQHVQPGRLIILPWDEHVAAGTEIQIELLGDTYKRRIIELAAALSDDFDRSEER